MADPEIGIFTFLTSFLRKVTIDLDVFGSGTLLDITVRFLLLTITVFIAATAIWRQYFEHAADPDSKLPLPPGCMGFPLVGETLSFLLFDHDFNTYREKKYGLISKTHLFGQPTIRICGAQNIRPILMGEHIIVDNNLPASTKMLLGSGGVSTSSPDVHRTRKKLLLQAMSPNVVSRCVPAIQETVRHHLQDWCSKGELLGQDACKNLTLSLVADVLLGFEVDKEKMEKIKSQMVIFVDNLFTLPWNIPGTGLNKALKAREFIVQAIKERMKIETKHWCVVDELKRISDGNQVFTDDEMANAILELWFAGNDTTATTSCLALMFLGQNTRIRNKVEEELKQNNLDDPKTDLSFDQIMKLSYLDFVIKEVVRLYPAAGGGFRKAKTVLEIGGYQVPKGWQILYGITDTHRNSEMFTDKDEFQPERWIGMEEKTRDIQNKFDFIPFGAGARQCPGKIFATTFVKIFIIELIRNSHWEFKNSCTKVLYFTMPHPADGLPVTFTLKDGLQK